MGPIFDETFGARRSVLTSLLILRSSHVHSVEAVKSSMLMELEATESQMEHDSCQAPGISTSSVSSRSKQVNLESIWLRRLQGEQRQCHLLGSNTLPSENFGDHPVAVAHMAKKLGITSKNSGELGKQALNNIHLVPLVLGRPRTWLLRQWLRQKNTSVHVSLFIRHAHLSNDNFHVTILASDF